MNVSPDILNALVALMEKLTPRCPRKERNRRYYRNRKERLKNDLKRLNPVLKPQPRWHRSLHHEQCHLVIEGEALCGAKKLSDGWREVPAGEGGRQCTRCLGKLKNYQ